MWLLKRKRIFTFDFFIIDYCTKIGSFAAEKVARGRPIEVQIPSGIKERLLRFTFGILVTALDNMPEGWLRVHKFVTKPSSLVSIKSRWIIQSRLYASFGCKEEWRSVEKPENLTIQSPSGKFLILSTVRQPDEPKTNWCAIAASIKERHWGVIQTATSIQSTN